MRATMARNKYYSRRVEFFETINRHSAQNTVYATVMRQRYYEAKLRWSEAKVIAHERERFAVYDAAAAKHGQELRDELAAEEEETKGMAVEEEYAEALIEAIIGEQFQNMKNERFNEGKEPYDRGMARYKALMADEDLADKRQAVLDDPSNLKRMQADHDLLINQRLAAMYGSTDSRSQVREPLKPLPSGIEVDRHPDQYPSDDPKRNHAEKVAAMREYMYGSMCPVEDLVDEDVISDEDDEDDHPLPVAPQQKSGGGNVDGSVDFVTKDPQETPRTAARREAEGMGFEVNYDPRQMSEEQQERLCAKIAKELGVDPKFIKLETTGVDDF